MPTIINGSTGIDQVNNNSITAADIQNAAVTTAKVAGQAITGDKLSGGQSATVPVFGAVAWCNFNGLLTGTNAPRAGGNVTSITRNGAGDYTINFTTALPDANYAVAGTVQYGAGFTSSNKAEIDLYTAGANSQTQTASSVRITVNQTNGVAPIDAFVVTVVVFR